MELFFAKFSKGLQIIRNQGISVILGKNSINFKLKFWQGFENYSFLICCLIFSCQAASSSVSDSDSELEYADRDMIDNFETRFAASSVRISSVDFTSFAPVST